MRGLCRGCSTSRGASSSLDGVPSSGSMFVPALSPSFLAAAVACQSLGLPPGDGGALGASVCGDGFSRDLGACTERESDSTAGATACSSPERGWTARVA